jgi:hypothetical protein
MMCLLIEKIGQITDLELEDEIDLKVKRATTKLHWKQRILSFKFSDSSKKYSMV